MRVFLEHMPAQELNFNIFTIPFFSAFLAISALIFIAFLAFVYIYFCFHNLKNGEIAVINRLDHIFIYEKGLVWSIPFLDNMYILPTQPRDFFIELDDIQNCEGIRFKIDTCIRAAIDPDAKSLTLAVKYIKSELDMLSIIKELLKSSMSIILMYDTSDTNALAFRSQEIYQQVENLLRQELFQRGIIFVSLTVQKIDDTTGYIKKLGSAYKNR